MRRIKVLVFAMIIALAGLMMPVAKVSAFSAASDCPPGYTNAKATNIAECNMKPTEGNSSLMGMIQVVINVLLSVIGVVAVLVIILGGVQYTTSLGDAGKVKKAKDTIMYGIIGLVIALLAFAIVNFVLGGIFGGGNNSGKAAGDYKDKTSCEKAGNTWSGGVCK